METEPSEIRFENGSDHAVVQAIQSCMRKVRLNISTVPLTLPVFTGSIIKCERVKVKGLGNVAGKQQERSKTMQYEELIQRPGCFYTRNEATPPEGRDRRQTMYRLRRPAEGKTKHHCMEHLPW